MRNIIFSVLLISIIFASCGEKVAVNPDNVLSRDSMIYVLAKIHVAEAEVVSMGLRPEMSKIKQEHINKVLKQYNISPKKYDDSFKYYASHPVMFNEMYELVIVAISQMQAEAKARATPKEN